jgi:peptidoglycan hydrolase-like protein with peptidoglycan-binding domain
MSVKIEKGLLSLAKKTLAVITASISSLITANSNPIIRDVDLNSFKEEDQEKFQLKILKPQLVLKQNVNNLSEPFLSMHTSHRSHSSHSSHVSSSSSGHYSHASHVSHASHYSSVPSYSPSNSVPYTPPATTSSQRTYNDYPVVSNKHSTVTSSYRTLEDGCEGKDVELLQVLLVKLKYDTYPTGIFSERTKRAVVQFQKDNQLIADGRVDTRTFEIIRKKAGTSSNASTPVLSNQSTSSIINRVLEAGCEGKDVEFLQDLLVKLKYDTYPTGSFSERTKRAVIQFPKDNQLMPDGRVDNRTFEIIQKKSGASSIGSIPVTNKQSARTAIYRVLEVGCEGNDVDSLQVLLLKLKYDIYPTGTFYERTKRAVIQFQKDNQLIPDGRVDARTFEIIQKKADELRFK